MNDEKKYILAISYSNTNVRIVTTIFRALETRIPNRVFFDKACDDQLVGMKGHVNLLEVYRTLSKYIVVICAGDYNNTYWTSEEWKTIHTYVDQNNIIPVSLDGSRPPGFQNAFFIKGKRKSGKVIAEEIWKAGLKNGFWTDRESVIAPVRGDSPVIDVSERSQMPQHQNSELKSGLIIVGDVVNFSSLPPANMPRVLTTLWRTAENARLLKGDWADLLGPFGAKPWLDLLGGEESIMVLISYNAYTIRVLRAFRPEGAFT
jgi:hypothetical protein